MIKNIKTLLDEFLSTVAPIDVPIAWHNIPYKPVKGQMYIRPTLLISPSTKLGFDDLQVNQGIYQIDIIYPKNKSLATLLDLMDDIYLAFRLQKSLTNGDSTVYINAISGTRFLDEDAWTVGTVQVAYTNWA